MNFSKEEIGAILKNLRIVSEMTQREVAEKLGKKQQIVGHWETGYSQPDANTLFMLCDLYGTTVNDAFGFSDKQTLSTHEQLHIKKYRRLSDNNRQAVDVTIDTMLIAQDAEKKGTPGANNDEKGVAG